MGVPSNVELMLNMLAMMAQQQEVMRKMDEVTTLNDLRLGEVKEPRYSGKGQESLLCLRNTCNSILK